MKRQYEFAFILNAAFKVGGIHIKPLVDGLNGMEPIKM